MTGSGSTSPTLARVRRRRRGIEHVLRLDGDGAALQEDGPLSGRAPTPRPGAPPRAPPPASARSQTDARSEGARQPASGPSTRAPRRPVERRSGRGWRRRRRPPRRGPACASTSSVPRRRGWRVKATPAARGATMRCTSTASRPSARAHDARVGGGSPGGLAAGPHRAAEAPRPRARRAPCGTGRRSSPPPGPPRSRRSAPPPLPRAARRPGARVAGVGLRGQHEAVGNGQALPPERARAKALAPTRRGPRRRSRRARGPRS